MLLGSIFGNMWWTVWKIRIAMLGSWEFLCLFRLIWVTWKRRPCKWKNSLVGHQAQNWLDRSMNLEFCTSFKIIMSKFSLLWRWGSARNASFWISLWCYIYIINSVYWLKYLVIYFFPFPPPPWRSTPQFFFYRNLAPLSFIWTVSCSAFTDMFRFLFG